MTEKQKPEQVPVDPRKEAAVIFENYKYLVHTFRRKGYLDKQSRDMLAVCESFLDQYFQ